MKGMFEKKVDLSIDEIQDLREEIYINIDVAEGKEKAIEAEKAASKATTSKLQQEMGEAIAVLRNNRKLLQAGHRLVQVESREFKDAELFKIITLELNTGELLNVKTESGQGSMLDHHLVAIIESKETLVEVINKHFTSYSEAPIQVINIDTAEYFAFRANDGDLRLMRNSYEAIPTGDLFKLTLENIAEAQQEVIEIMEQKADDMGNIFGLDIDDSEPNHYDDED